MTCTSTIHVNGVSAKEWDSTVHGLCRHSIQALTCSRQARLRSRPLDTKNGGGLVPLSVVMTWGFGNDTGLWLGRLLALSLLLIIRIS